MSSINLNDNSNTIQYPQQSEAERERIRSANGGAHGTDGVKAVQAGVAVDGTTSSTPSSGTSSQSGDTSSIPSLPDPQGKTATAEQTSRVVSGSSSFVVGGDSIFAALDALSKMAKENYKTAQQVKFSQNKIAADAKKDEYNAEKERIHGDHVSSITTLVGSVGGLVAAGGLGFAGVKMELGSMSGSNQVASSGTAAAKEGQATGNAAGKGSTAGGTSAATQGTERNNDVAQAAANKQKTKAEALEKQNQKEALEGADMRLKATQEAQTKQPERTSEEKQQSQGTVPAGQSADNSADAKSIQLGDDTADNKAAWGSALKNAGFSASQVVTGFTGMMDTLVGGKYDSDQAKLEQKGYAITGQIAQTNADQASGSVDQAKDLRKGTQDAMLRHVQMWGDSITNLWR